MFTMKTLVGGAVAAVLGVIGLAVWFGAFLQLIAGALPIMLLIGGGLALYLGFDELKDSWKNEEGVEVKSNQDRIAELEKELEALKKS
ncbi:hypothetical protein [Desulfobotulus sp.]|uniref:hypothetical protein n=1 Tax=Desulfobotulus sp. TaxID=1940337 RepID=UPI002A36ADFC|nr:hypothetical protein [Desulfobotulus sp.]MDY0161883.1 hypothetical protein [Desulfobotulus sp.]